jgi:hypothetical protein
VKLLHFPFLAAHATPKRISGSKHKNAVTLLFDIFSGHVVLVQSELLKVLLTQIDVMEGIP